MFYFLLTHYLELSPVLAYTYYAVFGLIVTHVLMDYHLLKETRYSVFVLCLFIFSLVFAFSNFFFCLLAHVLFIHIFIQILRVRLKKMKEKKLKN